MLNVKAKWGFVADREEMDEMVQDFVQANKDANGPIGPVCRIRQILHPPFHPLFDFAP